MTPPLTLLGYIWNRPGGRTGPVRSGEPLGLIEDEVVGPSDVVLEVWGDGKEFKFLPHDRRHLRVLIVDACRDAADSLALLVRMWQCDTQVAYDNGSALTLAHAYVPDVMVLDIGIPRQAGFGFAATVLAEVGLEDILLIAVSGHGDESSRARAREMGLCHYLVKPVEPRVIEGMLARRSELLGKPDCWQSWPLTFTTPRAVVHAKI
jgi:CheY-like chemotaxis protein